MVKTIATNGYPDKFRESTVGSAVDSEILFANCKLLLPTYLPVLVKVPFSSKTPANAVRQVCNSTEYS